MVTKRNIVLLKPGNAGGGKGLMFPRLFMSVNLLLPRHISTLPTPKVQILTSDLIRIRLLFGYRSS